MKKFLLLIIVLIILAATVSIAFLASESNINKSKLTVNAPFGIGWETPFDSSKVEYYDYNFIGCEKNVTYLENTLNEEFSSLEKACYDVHQAYSIPTNFNASNINAHFYVQQLIGLEYAYLHTWFDQEKYQEKRNKRANILHKHLADIYGPALIDKTDRQKAKEEDFIDATCSTWIIDNVGIELCDQRVQYIDGVEMSLSYFLLDNEFNGELIRCAYSNASISACEDLMVKYKFNLTIINEFTEDLKNIDRDCQSADLFEIENLPALNDIQSKTIELTKIYDDPDVLALFAINLNISGLSEEDKRLVRYILLDKAAKNGSSDAMLEMGNTYFSCQFGNQKNLELAKKWLRAAKDKGDNLAPYNLGMMYLKGFIPSENPIESARENFQICAKLGNDDCKARLSFIDKFLRTETK